ncbi:MAG: GGDEF domain-containing protein, partial [Thiohalospira sp.]
MAPNRGAGLESEVLYRARHDPVTGAYNRWELEQRLNAALRRSLETSLAVLDLDRFKEVNDRAGHAAGDILLQRIARGLHQRLRDTDFIARMGGD